MTEYSRELQNSPEKKEADSKRDKINCFKCEYFTITWNEKHPRACKLFGFKGKELPSVTVKRVTGRPCPAFKEKKNE